MAHTRWQSHPRLDRPIVVAAFEGWNDAGDAATFAAGHLCELWDLKPFASIDAEEFFDFTATRPQVRLEHGHTRAIEWPENTWYAGRAPGGRDVVVLVGTEPSLRWRTFCDEVLEVARRIDASMVVTLGALLADIPHRAEVPLVGTAHDPELIERLGLRHSTYEGPTGIVGVLHAVCQEQGLPSVSLWAAVPTYVPGATSPKAALALLQRLGDLLATGIELTDLEIESADYERQVDQLVADDDDLRMYVERLEAEQEAEASLPTGDDLAAELERFLRDNGGAG